MEKLTEHWDEIFKKTDDEKMGWYENDFSQTLKLLNLIPEWKKSRIFIPGVGTSGIIDIFLKSKAQLVLNDLSPKAIEKAKTKYNNPNIEWLCHDISKALPAKLDNVDIWIDRAVLHFLTNKSDIMEYFNNVKSKLKVGGYVIFAEFSETGALECAGLTLHRYSIKEMSDNLGSSFKIVSQFEFTYINPFGDPRPYIYALFKREM